MKKWTERMKNLIYNIDDMQIPVYAANACYFLAISIFPALLLLLASLRYTPLSATDLIRLLERVYEVLTPDFMTFAEDMPGVRKAFRDMADQGIYSVPLFA